MASKREAVAKAERAFKLFDKDNDGYITKEEFQKISKKLNKQQARTKRIAIIAFSYLLFIIQIKTQYYFLLSALWIFLQYSQNENLPFDHISSYI